MMRNLLFIYFSFISIVTYSHSEIFNITDGEFIPDQDFNKNYSFNLFFNQDVFVDEIGIDFLDLGQDGFANLEIKIYCKDSLIFFRKDKFGENFNQIAYFEINKIFQNNKEYVFLILNLDIYSYNDNKIALFKPNNLPYIENSNTFINNEVGSSFDSIPQFNSDNLCPFVHIGTTTQKGIFFSNMDNYLDFEETPYGFSRSTKFKMVNENIIMKGIGLSYYDSGIDNTAYLTFDIINPDDNTTILSLDTLLTNHHKSTFFIKTSLDLIFNKEYILKVNFFDDSNKDDLVIIYKPDKIPYLEKTNYTQITNLYKDNAIDTVGLPFAFSFDEKKLNLNSPEKFFLNIKINQFNIFLETPFNSNDISNIELYSLIGEKTPVKFENLNENTFEMYNYQDLIGFHILIVTDKNGGRFYKTLKL